MTTKLSVNVNKVATLRNTRTLEIPSVTKAARICLDAGAHGITVHPRPDQRHIRPYDVTDLAALLKDFPDAEYNIEGNPFESFLEHIEAVRPDQCTLVPDSPDAFTSDHGWDIPVNVDRLRPMIAKLKELGCRVSVFMDADPEMVAHVPKVGADRIELYTEPYASAFSSGAHQATLDRFRQAAQTARDLGLGVNAGHDLNLQNLGPFLEAIPFVAEVSIGHALIADALEWGLAETVRRYLEIVNRSA